MAASEMMSGHYYSDEVNVIDKLYSPCFRWANHYVRNAGYFSSHIYQAMSKDVLEFILRNKANHITLFTNIDIYPPDYDAIVNDMDCSNEQVMQELRDMLEEETIADPVKMLAAIVASGQMTVYVSLRKRSDKAPNSIDHSKSGFFYLDEDNIVAFSGSFNETYPAVIPELDEGNKEHFSIHNKTELSKSNWMAFGEKITKRLNDDMAGPFPKNNGKGTIIVKIEDIKREDLPSLSADDWNPQNHQKRANERSELIYDIFNGRIATNVDQEFNPRPHQIQGLENWKQNQHRGILEHATGSGKTITALLSVKDHVDDGKPALILVPSRLLLEQWIKEVSNFIPDASIITAGTGHNRWKDRIHIWLDGRVMEGKKRITIAIIHTAKSQKFLNQVKKSENLLVIVDECHRIGAPSFTKICEINPSKVLGLSATPLRGDDGDERVSTLCGDIVHEYRLEDAIRDGYLTEYVYNIERASLNPSEQSDYEEIKIEIARTVNKFRDKNGKIDFKQLPQSIQLKFIQAKRIIKKAEEKTAICAEILERNYAQNEQQKWLIYCEDSEQLNSVRQHLESKDIDPIYEYWSDAKGAIYGDSKDQREFEFDREGTIASWEQTGGILLAILCLDEGVNIPAISHGIILASSNNPRQFIQRRGRLLRLHEGKILAYIWDVVVVPRSDSDPRFNSYLLSEIARAEIFSTGSHSGNSRRVLIDMKSIYGIDNNSHDIVYGG